MSTDIGADTELALAHFAFKLWPLPNVVARRCDWYKTPFARTLVARGRSEKSHRGFLRCVGLERSGTVPAVGRGRTSWRSAGRGLVGKKRYKRGPYSPDMGLSSPARRVRLVARIPAIRSCATLG